MRKIKKSLISDLGKKYNAQHGMLFLYDEKTTQYKWQAFSIHSKRIDLPLLCYFR